METHVLDLIDYVSGRGIPARIIARRIDWPGPRPAGIEFIRVPDRTPFSRLNNHLFEMRALSHRRSDWPTIAISRTPGADLCIVGGTHLGHLADRGKLQPGFFDRRTIAREGALYAQARRIVAHSSKVAGEIARYYGIPSEKITTLYPPVDTRRFSLAARQDRDRLRREIGIAPHEFLLLFPSNNHPLKGADLILDALKAADPRFRLVVAGKAPLNGARVINLGFRNDMPALYAAADAVILASKYEAFGLVGPEAILCGTPVLFANTVGAAEVLSEEACLRFERTVPSLQAALARALQKFGPDTPPISEPAQHIHYPYSTDLHFDALFELLVATQAA